MRPLTHTADKKELVASSNVGSGRFGGRETLDCCHGNAEAGGHCTVACGHSHDTEYGTLSTDRRVWRSNLIKSLSNSFKHPIREM